MVLLVSESIVNRVRPDAWSGRPAAHYGNHRVQQIPIPSVVLDWTG